jgi:hypothetical protein
MPLVGRVGAFRPIPNLDQTKIRRLNAWACRGPERLLYREREAGARSPSFETWDRICKLFGWPQTFAGRSTTLGSPRARQYLNNCTLQVEPERSPENERMFQVKIP